MMSIVSSLAELRRAAGISQREIAAALGLSAKVGNKVVSNWESGVSIPNIGHTVAYALAVGHRVVVTKDGKTVGDLVEVYPRLPELREAAGRSKADVAAALYVHWSSIRTVELHAGPGAQLATAVRYLGALGYRVELIPCEAVASCR